jgi:hypothetical protein
MKWRGWGAKEIKWPGRRGRMRWKLLQLARYCTHIHQFGAQEDPAAPLWTRRRVTPSFVTPIFEQFHCHVLPAPFRDKVEPRCQLLGALPVPEKIHPCCFLCRYSLWWGSAAFLSFRRVAVYDDKLSYLLSSFLFLAGFRRLWFQECKMLLLQWFSKVEL